MPVELHQYPIASIPAAGSRRLVAITDGDQTPRYDDGSNFHRVDGWLTAEVTWEDVTVTLGKIPANSIIVDRFLQVTTPFDGGTTHTIALGIAGDTGKYMAATTVKTGDFSKGTDGSDTAPFENGYGLETVERTAIATVAESGTASTAGKAIVGLHFVRVAPLSS